MIGCRQVMAEIVNLTARFPGCDDVRCFQRHCLQNLGYSDTVSVVAVAGIGAAVAGIVDAVTAAGIVEE